MQTKNNDRPTVICDILMSLDGKISGAFLSAPQAAPALKAYNELRGTFGCRATLYGTTTMAEGDPKAVSLFAASPFAPDFAGAAFRLIEAKPWEGDALWLHYRAE